MGRCGMADEPTCRLGPGNLLPLRLGHARPLPFPAALERRRHRLPAASDHAADAGRAGRPGRRRRIERRRQAIEPDEPPAEPRVHRPCRARRRQILRELRPAARGLEGAGLHGGEPEFALSLARSRAASAPRSGLRRDPRPLGNPRAARTGRIPVSALFPGFSRRQIKTGGATINLVTGGKGPAVLLLHGYPETHAMWHKVAPVLAREYTVVCPDLRGYGDSSKPNGLPDHSHYSKRAVALDMVEVMDTLGPGSFHVVGHDRGGRVAHRLARDHGSRVKTLTVLDISPTLNMYKSTNFQFRRAYYHWFLLIQESPIP